MRLFLALAAANGFLAVLFGAFGAHALKARLVVLPDGAERLAWWSTATTYHLTHALALGLVAFAFGRGAGTPLALAGWGFQLGIVLFAGSLYVMALTGVRALGAVTPFGGLLLLTAWVALFVSALRA